MNRLYDFIRRHPTWVDSLWAVFLLLLSSVWIIASISAPDETSGLPYGPKEQIASIPIALTMCVVVALRRRAPEKMLLLATGAGLAQVITDVEPFPGNLAFLVIIFTVASRHTRWASRFALAGSLLAPAIDTARWPNEHVEVTGQVFGTLFMTLAFVLAWVLGDSLRTRRAYYSQLEERATRLEKEREAQAKVAVAAERARIARELHDVVAHNVSVMVVQADGAAYVLDTAPDQARMALETISGTGRQALAEMRRLLGVLRTGDGGKRDGGEYVPQPGVEQVADLVEQVRGAGLTVNFRIEGTPRSLPSSVELTAYRIVQEALTNTRKHGGPDVGASVLLRYGDDELSVLAEDDGRGAQRELYQDGGTDGLGHGLIGMRERVGMVGGALEAGPRPGGGFRINAALPLKGAD
ncbi:MULTISPECIES: sensor histidine kinase [unclassified Streptomyces]|uniref:sensor histidine kinase n=1 Tax=unclassified Streptomyces TaxID=2593676 RepID=UPI002DDACB0E|nr:MULTISPECIES: sensor histidine kinase [unclassified Streptomyces]WSA93195.1 sensor histidine kinase [Streptomyces sp. NBC_01795]WSB77566.1 sensor histidine kinase [Streptomyces sp. NBC_01775]WSS14168.1 sensor histidine kinase [Streptomyces sp. NBC_01186]WSS42989.1 sensor histidine kinase [Streptomyces sp. NBC_01187]